MDKLIIDLKEILNKILIEKDIKTKEDLINDFQNKVWSDYSLNEKDPITDIFVDLAHDLEFYESDTNLYDISSYGDERLEREIKEAIDKINNIERDRRS